MENIEVRLVQTRLAQTFFCPVPSYITWFKTSALNCSICSFSSHASTQKHSDVFAELNSRLEDANRTISSGAHHTRTTPHIQLQIKMFFFIGMTLCY